MAWLPKKTVVVPVDFSPASASAVETALQLAARHQDVHVLPATVMIYGDVLALGS